MLFSIVIPSFNQGRFLQTALDSVYKQSFRDFEIIVVDGQSTDSSPEIIKRNVDRIAWWCSEKDGGQSDALNKGFSHAKGKYLTWLNADDILFPDALESVSKIVQKSGQVVWVTGNMVFLNEKGRIIRCVRDGGWHLFAYRYAPVRVYGPSSFFTRSLLEEVGGLDVTLRYSMDSDLWQKFRKLGAKYVRVQKYLWGFRSHPGSKTNGGEKDLEGIKFKERLYVAQKFRLKIPSILGSTLLRVRRIFDGSYFYAIIDSLRFYGRDPVKWKCLRLAFLEIHPAPYRESFLSYLSKAKEIVLDVYDYQRTDFYHPYFEKCTNVANREPLGRGIHFWNSWFHIKIFLLFILGKYDCFAITAHSNMTSLLAISLCHLFHKPYVYMADTVEERLRGKLLRRFKRWMYSGAKFLFVTGERFAEFYGREYGIEKNRLLCGYYSFDYPEICLMTNKAKQEKKDIRRKYGIPQCGFVYLMAANFLPFRQQDLLISAFVPLCKKDKECYLVLLGSGVLKNELKVLARKNEVEDKIVFIDSVGFSQLLEILGIVDVYVHSGKEPYSTMIPLAIAANLPVLTSKDIPSTVDFMLPQDGILLESATDLMKWADGLEEIKKFIRPPRRSLPMSSDVIADFFLQKLLGLP